MKPAVLLSSQANNVLIASLVSLIAYTLSDVKFQGNTAVGNMLFKPGGKGDRVLLLWCEEVAQFMSLSM
jgi:hypothetical protein